MKLHIMVIMALLPIIGAAEQVRRVDGISVIGNRELPKSLIIVPWKGAKLSDEPNLPEKSLVDNRFELVDRKQLLREIQFYKLQK